MNELINLIISTDTANPAALPELYKQITSAWDALNNERSGKHEIQGNPQGH